MSSLKISMRWSFRRSSRLVGQNEGAGRHRSGARCYQAGGRTVDLGCRRSAKLSHAFDQVVEAVDVSLGETTAGGVDGDLSVGPAHRARLDERTTLALPAEA